MISPSIFKSYDIRGLVASELSGTLAYQLGRALVVFFEQEGVSFERGLFAVGYDMRTTSVEYTRELVRGITDQGVDVAHIGLVSTPLFNITVAREEQYLAGVMVTASHNPAEYNGFKITRGNGLPVGMGSGMEMVRDLTIQNQFGLAQRKGSEIFRDPTLSYVEQIMSLVDISSITPKKVVVDYGNGMGSVILPNILSRLPLEVVSLYDTPDGTFPNHEANPLRVDTLRDLQKKVIETGADFGFALDGDADRIGLVDERGEIVPPSQVGILLGLEVLRLHNNVGHMLYDLRSSTAIKEAWEAAGATTQMCRVGHAHIKKQVRDTGAIFASELSLHLYYGDLYGVESSDFSCVLIASLLSRQIVPLSTLVAPYMQYAHSGEINFHIEDKDGAIDRIISHFRNQILEENTLDGAWFRCEWGWVSLRKSNTEPVLRLNLETAQLELTKEKVNEITQLLVSK